MRHLLGINYIEFIKSEILEFSDIYLKMNKGIFSQEKKSSDLKMNCAYFTG